MRNGKLTTCKACGAEIAKSAKTCPYCGAKNKGKHPILSAVLIVLGIFLIIGALNPSSEPTKVGEVEATIEQDVQTTFGVGEKVSLDDVVVTLLDVTESSGSTYNKPAVGNVFVLCEFEIENNSSGDIGVSSIMSFDCYCDDYATSSSLSATLERGNKAQLDGSVASGKKMNGVIGYEVPKDWKELEVRFTPSFWSRKDIVFVAKH